MAEKIAGRQSIADIPADSLRETLRQTMVMGLPATVADRPTFFFDGVQTWDDEDTEGSPWDWTASNAPTADTAKASVQALCAYQFYEPLGRQGSNPTEVGEFNPTTVKATMFETEFDSVYGFTYMTIGPSSQKWYFRHFQPGIGLGTLEVYQVTCVAVGRS